MNAIRGCTNVVAGSVRRASALLAIAAILFADAPVLPAQAGAAPAAKPDQKKSAPANPQAPKLAAPPATNCPAGQVPVKQESPFGTMTLCADAQTQPPATPPATAPTGAPSSTAPSAGTSSGGVTVQTGAPKPAAPTQPSATAAPSGATEAPAAEPKREEIAPPASGDGAVALNLENADLYQVLRILGGELKINYIVDPAVKGTVTINTSGSVSRKELFSLLQMILAINGAAAVKSNGYYAIVPLGSAKQQPLNFHFAKEAEATPLAEDAFTLLVVPMKFISAAEMSKILTPFMSPAGQIVVQDKGNIMLITESAAKLAQLQEIINVFDDAVLGRQRVHIFPVTNNLAANIITDLKSVFGGYGLTTGTTAIQFVPLNRLNSILAISAAPEVFPEVEQWIKKLDQPAHDAGIRNFVYKVQNAKAADLREIIAALYGASGSTAGRSQSAVAAGMGASAVDAATVMGPQNGALAAPATGPMGAPQAPATPRGPAAEPESVGPRMEAPLRIMADERNNALIIQATQHDYEMLQRTLEDLDVLPRQVLIDARIYEIDLTGDLSLGLSAFLDKKSAVNTNTTASFNSPNTGLALQTFAIFSNAKAVQIFVNASENRSKIKTLSAPSILVTDNTQARIQVGSEVPVPIGSALTPVQSGGSSIFAQTIQFRDTGVILSVTPRINASGIVTLNLAQEVSTAQPNTTSAIVAPVISKSMFQTTAILRDGQTLALGGIITSSDNLSKQRVPLIGDIPGIGLLFGNTSRNTARKELVLLITPHVAQDMGEAATVSSDFVRQMKNLKKEMRQAGAAAPQGK